MRFVAVLNKDGGTFRTMDMAGFSADAVLLFAARGHSLDCRIVSGSEVVAALTEAAIEGDVDAVLAGGGDGTISTAAEICFEKGRMLAVLPAGTMNLFARALGMPTDLQLALEAIAEGAPGKVDIATANGVPFVHQFGVGIHARLVRIRESLTYRSRFGKMLASLRAILAAVLRPPRFQVEIHSLRGVERRIVSGISVSNNPVGEGHIPFADRLDKGVLGVYVAKPMSSWALTGLAFRVLIGRWKSHPMVIEREVEEITLTFPRRKRSAQAVVDGELIDLDDQVILKIHPGALPVILPPDHAA